MLEIILGIASSVITELAKKSGVSANIIVVVLSIIFGAIYFVLQKFYPEMMDFSWQTILAIYGVSQLIYNFLFKLLKK